MPHQNNQFLEFVRNFATCLHFLRNGIVGYRRIFVKREN